MKFVNWLGLGALAMSSAAVAGPYVGGAGTFSQYEYEDVDDATSFSAFAGYRFDSAPVMIEVAYTDAGKHDIKGLPSGVGLKFAGVRGSLGYFAKLDSKGSGVWLKAGYYDGDSDLELPNTPFNDMTAASKGFTYGLGGDWKITPWFGLRFDLENYLDVRDFSDFPVNGGDGGESDVSVISLGLVFELPSSGSSSSSRSSYTPPPAPAPAPAPAYTPAPAAMPPEPVATPAPAPQPVLAPAPVAPAAAAAPAGKPVMPIIGIRRTSQPTALLRQPRAGAPVDGSLPAGAEVQLMQRVPNALGVWWYVYAGNTTGWVNDSALAPQ